MAIELQRLKSVLNTSGLQQKDPALYQVIVNLLEAVQAIQNNVTTITGGAGGGGSLANKSYVTIENELATLPFSRRVVAGNGISFNNDGQRLIISSVPQFLVETEEGEPGIIGPPGIQGPAGVAGAAGLIGPPGMDADDSEIEIPIFPLVNLGLSGAMMAFGAGSTASGHSPADSTTYFFSTSFSFNPVTGESTAGINFPHCFVRKAVVTVSVFGTLASAEDVAFSIRKNSSDEESIGNIKFNTATQTLTNPSMNFHISDGDRVYVKFVTPAWVTNPTLVFYSTTLFLGFERI